MSAKLLNALLVATSVVLGTTGNAQQWQVFNMDNAGLPSNTVNDIVQDGQGAIWAATDWGLCHYENGIWSVIQQEDGLPSNSLNCLAVDADDRLWVGTETAGIGIYDGSNWIYLNADNSPLVADGVKHIFHDHRGWVWISTELGLYVDTGAGWRVYDNTPESYNGNTFFGPNVRAVAVRSDDLVAIATLNAGLTYITETDFIYYTASNSNFPDNSANGVAIDANGDRWLATPSGGLIWHAGDFLGGPWFAYNAFTAGIPDNTLLCVVIDSEGRKLAGSETAGILVFNGPGSWSVLNTANSGLPDNFVRSLFVDDAGILWAGTLIGGVARFDPGTGIGQDDITSPPIRVFPNPWRDQLTIDLSELHERFEWRLLDPLGRLVANGALVGGALRTVELDGLTTGTYLLSVWSKEIHMQVRILRD